jgi:5-oxoprolinase (ATP-hydrolysing) subunit B
VTDDLTSGPAVVRLGERAVIVRTATQDEVLDLAAALVTYLAARRLVDIVPGDRSLLVVFDGTDAGEVVARDAIAAALGTTVVRTPRRHVIPVRYGGTDGPDLDEAATLAGITPRDLIERHAGRDYPVLFIGFAPGFPYIGGLPPELVLPRLATPRTSTPAGSVAIAETYTGIYPAPLPGGWRVIGRTTLLLFDSSADPPTTLQPGDLVRFEAIP